MNFIYKAVERIPKRLESGIVYHSEEFEVAALLCACGCGHRVSLLVPDSHQVYDDRELATIRPSISVCDAPCKSHYYVTAGRVEMLEAFSPGIASWTMQRQIARHANVQLKRLTWRDRLKARAVAFFRSLGSWF